MLNKLKPLQLAALSGIIGVIAWPPLPLNFLLLVMWVPLLLMRDKMRNEGISHGKIYLYTTIGLILFNAGTTWWVWNASDWGSVFMVVANSFLLALPMLMYSLTVETMPKLKGLSFVVYYLLLEYWHFNWTAAWPWLTMGKGFASFPMFIQWYEFTGETGGSLLIYLINFLVYQALSQSKLKKLILPGSIVCLAFLASLGIYFLRKNNLEKIETLNCIISQPNVDPYLEKYGNGPEYLYPEIQVEKALDPVIPLMHDSVDIVLMPETAIIGNNIETALDNNFIIEPLRNLTKKRKVQVIAGAETYKLYSENEKRAVTARFSKALNKYYEFYNSALNIRNGSVDSIYHKSRLVPGVEKMPFPFLEKLSIDLGGTSGSLGMSEYPVNFVIDSNNSIAPLICYESVFGEYASEFVKKGATALAVITNDGWWGNTPGHTQHLLYGAIRCIENRKQMIRSANTGISAHINEFGQITQRTKYDEQTAFACRLETNSTLTFYSKFGDWLGKSSILGILLAINVLIRRKIKKKENMTS